MQKTIRLLALLLAVQVVAAVALGFSAPRLAARPDPVPLLALADAVPDRIAIANGDGDSVELIKTDAGWQVAVHDGFPADSAKVEGLLRQLRELTYRAPVATSSSAHARLKVAEDAFERRITLAAGEDTLATLYRGSSPSVRRMHARRADDNAVHEVEFASYEAPATASDWIDKTVLQLPADEVTALQVADLRLVRTAPQQADEAADEAAEAGPAWQAEGLDQPPNQAAVDDLVRRLTQLRIGDVLGREARPEYGLEQPRLTLTLERGEAEPVEYRLGKMADEDGYVLKTSLRPEYFRLPSYTGEGLVEAADRETLLAADS